MSEFLFLVLIVAIVIALWVVKTYNSLQFLMQEIRESYANLQAALKKREQINGQMIDIASKYMEHEQLMQLQVAQKQGDMKQIRYLAQDFPELRANETYQKLMDQLESAENDILEKRESYNNRVKRYNASRSAFPAVLIASRLSFDNVDYFNVDDEKFDMQAAKFAKDDSEALKKNDQLRRAKRWRRCRSRNETNQQRCLRGKKDDQQGKRSGRGKAVRVRFFVAKSRVRA